MSWTRLVLVWSEESLSHDSSGSPQKHHHDHTTCLLRHPTPDNFNNFPDSELVSQSLFMFWTQSRAARKPSNFNVLFLMQPGFEPPTLHMPGKCSTTTLPAIQYFVHGRASITKSCDNFQAFLWNLPLMAVTSTKNGLGEVSSMLLNTGLPRQLWIFVSGSGSPILDTGLDKNFSNHRTC